MNPLIYVLKPGCRIEYERNLDVASAERQGEKILYGRALFIGGLFKSYIKFYSHSQQTKEFNMKKNLRVVLYVLYFAVVYLWPSRANHI